MIRKQILNPKRSKTKNQQKNKITPEKNHNQKLKKNNQNIKNKPTKNTKPK